MTGRLPMLCALCALCAFVLSGCGGSARYWYGSQKDEQSAKKDLFECEEEAAAFSRNMGESGNKDIVKKRLKDCMGLRGYLNLPADELPKGAYKVR